MATLHLIHELRLSGMAQAFEERAAMPDNPPSSPSKTASSLLLEREKTEREQRRYVRLNRPWNNGVAGAPCGGSGYGGPRGLQSRESR